MREIKFRFWLGHTKKMTYAHDLKEVGSIIPEFTDDIIPMQFTGLKDKNGTDIYEGDRLLYIGTNMSEMEVKFIDGSFVGEGPFNTHPLMVYITAVDFESIEVIGNIYEHPHFLSLGTMSK